MNQRDLATSINNQEFVRINDRADQVFCKNAVEHGFWADIELLRDAIATQFEGQERLPAMLRRFDAMVMAEKIALIHSELSEALEAIRKDPDAPDEKVPAFSNLDCELSDAKIRIGDLAAYKGLRVNEATMAKHAYNVTRPYKHGKQS